MIEGSVSNSACGLNKALLKPFEYLHLVRLGPNRDGGYVVPGDQIVHCETLISLGLSDDWSFDKACLALNPVLKIIGVDHTVGPLPFTRRILRSLWKIPLYALTGNQTKRTKYTRKLRNHIDYFIFFRDPHRHIKKRVSSGTGPLDINLQKIFDLAESSDSGCNVFLKMDIEGSEYEVISDIVRHQHRIRCIAAEFHHLDKNPDDFNTAVRALTQQFYIVHIHANNYGGYHDNFPATVEITFVNKSLFEQPLLPSRHQYPREKLDFPNNPKIPDYRLQFE